MPAQQSSFELGEACFAAKDYTQAFQYFKIAEQEGITLAYYFLYLHYRDSLGVARSEKEKEAYLKKIAADAVTKAWVQKKAGNNDAEAQVCLSIMYCHGYGFEQDHAQAVYWYRKAAGQDHTIAQNNLGVMYELGQGVTRDDAQAADWYRKAAEQSDATAQCNLGVMYEKGLGVVQDYTQAAAWFRKAAEQGYANAQYNLGVMYRKGLGVIKDYHQAANWYRKAAEQGDATAQFKLGAMHYDGLGVAQDYAQAVDWFRKAAEQDHATAQFNLGVMYKNGLGVAQDYVQAVYWYHKAAEQEYAAAQCNLGLMYENGLGIAQDYVQAVYWYRKAAEQDQAIAQNNLGVICYNGRGIEQDHAQAAGWFRKAAEQDLARAQCNLGVMYENGQGVDQNPAEAFYWYRKAAEQGYASAQCKLGNLYLQAQDYDGAAIWFRKAAEQGDAEAQFNLGVIYIEGLNVEQDYIEAAKWFHKAANQGDATAQFNLSIMYLNGQGVAKDKALAWFWRQQSARHRYTPDQTLLNEIPNITPTQKAAAIVKEILTWENLQQLNLSRFTIDNTLLRNLIEQLANSKAQHALAHLHTLNLAHNKLNSAGINLLQQLIAYLPSLTHLDLSHNQIGSGVVGALFNLVKNNPTLIAVNLDRNPLFDYQTKAELASLLKINQEALTQYKQALILEKQALLYRNNPDAIETCYVDALACAQDTQAKRYPHAQKLAAQIQLALGKFYAEYNYLSLAFATLKPLLTEPAARQSLAELLLRTKSKQELIEKLTEERVEKLIEKPAEELIEELTEEPIYLPFSDPLDKYRLILLLLRDDEEVKDTMPLRQAINCLQQESAKAGIAFDLKELIQAEKLITYQQLLEIASAAKNAFTQKLQVLRDSTEQSKQTLRENLKGQDTRLQSAIANLDTTEEQEAAPLETKIAQLQDIISVSQTYSKSAYQQFIENTDIQSALITRFGTKEIQIVENFLELPEDIDISIYQEYLLNELEKHLEIDLLEAKQAAEVRRQTVRQEQKEKQALLEKELLEYTNKNRLEAQALHQSKLAEVKQQEETLPKISAYYFSFWQKLGILGICLALAAGVTTALFFLSLPLWAVAAAGALSFAASGASILGYSTVRHYLTKSNYNHSPSTAILSTNAVTAHLQTPIDLPAPFPSPIGVTPNTFNQTPPPPLNDDAATPPAAPLTPTEVNLTTHASSAPT